MVASKTKVRTNGLNDSIDACGACAVAYIEFARSTCSPPGGNNFVKPKT